MKNKHILLVEDDEFVSKAYAYFLRKAGVCSTRTYSY